MSEVVNPIAAKRYFIDTEYDWFPHKGVLCPISIALVSEDGREYYAECITYRNGCVMSDFARSYVEPVIGDCGKVVCPELRSKRLPSVRNDIIRFIGYDTPEFWGDYAAFDYVMLSMIMGEFSDWPDFWPMHVNDLQQESIPSLPSARPHNALADARAVRDSFNHSRGIK